VLVQFNKTVLKILLMMLNITNKNSILVVNAGIVTSSKIISTSIP